MLEPACQEHFNIGFWTFNYNHTTSSIIKIHIINSKVSKFHIHLNALQLPKDEIFTDYIQKVIRCCLMWWNLSLWKNEGTCIFSSINDRIVKAYGQKDYEVQYLNCQFSSGLFIVFYDIYHHNWIKTIWKCVYRLDEH